MFQARTGVAIILITHDMGVVAEMATLVLVLRDGRKVEEAPVRRLFAAPEAPYTRDLLAAVPRLGSTAGTPDRAILAGLGGFDIDWDDLFVPEDAPVPDGWEERLREILEVQRRHWPELR